MNKIRTSLLVTTAVAALGVAAIRADAADLTTKAPYVAPQLPVPFTWTGFYVGAHVGYAWSSAKSTSATSEFEGAATNFNVGDNAWTDGGLFGAQVGYDYQFAPQWVFGVQGDWDGASMNGFSYTSPYKNCCFMWTKVDWIASVTGRLGYTGWDPRTMLYVKGGAAWLRDEFMFSYAENSRQTRTGWTIGGGIAWAPAFLPNWEVFVEGDWYDFGTKAVPVCYTHACSSVDVQRNVAAVKIGANYKFNFGGR